MPSTFTRIWPHTGGGNSRDDGHHDAVITVLQRETGGNELNPQAERVNAVSKFSASAQAVPPANLGLTLDNLRVERFANVKSAVLWTFQYSNDNWFNLGVSGGQGASIPNGNFNSNPVPTQFSYPAILETGEIALIDVDGDSVPEEVPVFVAIPLVTKPENLRSWKVKTTSNYWNIATERDIAARVNTIHLIDGNYFLFNGVTSNRKINDTSYEVVYEWIIDPGNQQLTVATDQGLDGPKLRLPAKVPFGDAALSMPFGPGFEGNKYVRLPYHSITLGRPEDPGTIPPFLQFRTVTFDAQYALDWQLLPGDPVGSL